MVGPKIEKPGNDVVQYYRDWIEKDGFPLWSFWDNVKTWWEIRNLPNVLLIHFNHLKDDLPGQIRKIAKFLEIKINEEKFPEIVNHCSFEYMKKKFRENSSKLC